MEQAFSFPCSGCGNCNFCTERAMQEDILPPCLHQAVRRAGGTVSPVVPPTEVLPDEAAMSRRCAQLMAQCLRQKPNALLCLAAGSTALGTFREFIRMVRSGEVDVSQARFVSLDEWVGLSEEAREEDCGHFLHRNFYDPLDIPPERLTLFDPDAPDLEAECARIDRVIRENGGIDFLLLGLGMNGHLGLNEPGADFRSYSHTTRLSSVTQTIGQKYFSRETTLSGGITTGIQHMFEARQVILQVCGGHKTDIVRNMYTSPVTRDLPATVFQVLPTGRVILDADAAREILELL